MLQQKKSWLILVMGTMLVLAGCVGLPRTGLRGGFAAIVVSGGNPGASHKAGLLGLTDTGREIFAAAGVGDVPDVVVSTYVGGTIPKWVRVTWRKDVLSGEYWTSGTVIGDYTIPVANRIPQEVFDYANARRGRAIRLIFRVKDDGVLFAWDVQETVVHPSGGEGYVNSLRGGDFPCDPVRPHANYSQSCTSGNLKDAPWYLPEWTFGTSL